MVYFIDSLLSVYPVVAPVSFQSKGGMWTWLLSSITWCIPFNPPSISTKMPSTERSFIMIKPDGVQRNLVGKILQRFEDRGYKIVAMKMVHATTEHLEQREYLSLVAIRRRSGLADPKSRRLR